MIKIANAQFWVHDQDEALAFYTTDARLGGASRRDHGGMGLPLAGASGRSARTTSGWC